MRDELSPYARLIDCVPDGFTPTGWIVAIQAFDAEGNMNLICRATEGLPTWTAAGMAMSLADDMRAELRGPQAVYIAGEDEDD